MNQIKTLSIKKEAVTELVQLILFLAIVSLAPLIGQQAVTGTIVNAVLLISVLVLGYQKAMLIAFLPSVLALSLGLLPLVLAPMIPFIITGNIILILVFNLLRKRNYWLSVTLAGFLKFIFLSFSVFLISKLFLKDSLAQGVMIMMGWPQFFTALAGGSITYLFSKNRT